MVLVYAHPHDWVINCSGKCWCAYSIHYLEHLGYMCLPAILINMENPSMAGWTGENIIRQEGFLFCLRGDL